MMLDPMTQAIDEAINGEGKDYNGVAMYWHYAIPTDELGRNLPVRGTWKPYVLIMSPNHRNQEVRRPVTDQIREKYPEAWEKFQANSDNELRAKAKYLEEQMASLRTLTGSNAAAAEPKKRGRPPKPQVVNVSALAG